MQQSEWLVLGRRHCANYIDWEFIQIRRSEIVLIPRRGKNNGYSQIAQLNEHVEKFT